MNAAQSSPVQSIQRRVLVWAMGALVVGASLLVGGSYLLLAHEMGEVFEDNLKQVALAVANHHGTYGMARTPALPSSCPGSMKSTASSTLSPQPGRATARCCTCPTPLRPCPFSRAVA